MSVRPSVRPYSRQSECVRKALTRRTSVEFDIEDFYENVKNIQIWLKSDKSIWHLTWRPKEVLVLPERLNRHKSALFYWNGIAMLFRPSISVFACISSAPTKPIYVKFDIGDFYENLLRNAKFSLNREKILGTLHEDLSTFYCCRPQ